MEPSHNNIAIENINAVQHLSSAKYVQDQHGIDIYLANQQMLEQEQMPALQQS